MLLTDEQVGERLNVPADTVRNLHRMGQLPGVKVGKHLRWRPCDVEGYVASLKGGDA